MSRSQAGCPNLSTEFRRTSSIMLLLILTCSAGCETEHGLTVGQTRADEVRTKSAPTPDQPTQDAHKKNRPPNRLARETSPYLLLHAHNPVDWYPWGPEAFEKARREKKPIFLSIGYSSCYWCHVMERKTFSDEDIAKYMNEHFVNIKVDREERPDVDDIYMTALIVYFRLIGSGQGGGWPLSMFLTPSGKPFAGGTYFPPRTMQGRPGFDTAMRRVNELWTTQKKQIEANADLVTREVQRSMTPNPLQADVAVDRELVKQVVASLMSSYDSEYGGVDFKTSSPNSPKFPVPAKLALLQYEIRRFDDERAADILYHTLDRIGSGGIRDHLGGGFHRYSTDRAWHVPHFEKMLYDQAQLADVYTEAYLRTNKQLYRQAVEDIFRYVQQHMTAPANDGTPGGGFYSALDAETNAIEGEYYVWSANEIEQALGGDDAQVFGTVYGLREENPFEHGYVIHLPRSISKAATSLKIDSKELDRRLATMRAKLLAVRDQRKSPLKDDKIITSWNGLMIRAYANAGRILGRKDYIQTAERAATFILTKMRDDRGRLLRTHRANTSRLNAYLDDYAFLIQGLLALHRATHEEKWLNAAHRLTDQQIELFWDPKGRGFYFTSHQHETLIARTKNAYDAVLPSGNSVSVRNLIRLASLTGDDSYRKRAQQTLEQFAPVVKQSPRGMTHMALAAGEFLDKTDYRLPQRGQSSRSDPQRPLPVRRVSDRQSSTGDKATDQTVSDAHVLSARAFLSTDRLPAGRSCELLVLLTVQPGWHIYANPPRPDSAIPVQLKVRSALGTRSEKIRYPIAHQTLAEGTEEFWDTYEGQVAIYTTLNIPGELTQDTEHLELTIDYQACTGGRCRPPARLKLEGQIPVAGIMESISTVNSSLFPKR